MKRKRSLFIIVVILLMIILIGSLLSYIIYTNRDKEPVDLISDYLISITSLVIAFIALIIALITYFSIDSVNNVTAMEGNVLENPNYAIAYSEIVTQLQECKTQKDFMNQLMEKMNQGLEQPTSSCIQFADCVQKIIDHLIWFGYVDFKDPVFKNQCETLVTRLEKEGKRYNTLSNGIQYLLNENIKLIKYVLNYQKERNLKKNQLCNLEDIRGKMILNPISQIIYYDYLGLDYKRKANEILRKCGSKEEELSVRYMKSVMDHDYSKEDIRHVMMLIKRAKECFEKARTLSEADVLWEGYIKYNEVRLHVMEFLIIKTNHNDILQNISEVVNIRETVCYFFQNESEETYLNTKFTFEYKNALSLYHNFNHLVNDN